MSFTNWEHLLCFAVSMVLRVPLDPGSRFHGLPDSVADIPALVSFLEGEGVGLRLLHLLFVGGIPRPGWEGFLVHGVGDVLHLPPTVG